MLAASNIPKAGQINVQNAPDINPVEFIKQVPQKTSSKYLTKCTLLYNSLLIYTQVVENINAQLLSLDQELGYASQGDSGHVLEILDLFSKFFILFLVHL